MPKIRKPPTLTTGQGLLKVRGETSTVDFTVEGDPAALRPGIAVMKGRFETTSDAAREAFRAGEAMLTIDERAFRIMVVAHTPGEATAYFEMRA